MERIQKKRQGSLATSARILAEMPAGRLSSALEKMSLENQLQLIRAADLDDRRILLSASPKAKELLENLHLGALLDLIAGGGKDCEWIGFCELMDPLKVAELIRWSSTRSEKINAKLAEGWIHLLLELKTSREIFNALASTYPDVLVSGLLTKRGKIDPALIEQKEIFLEVINLLDFDLRKQIFEACVTERSRYQPQVYAYFNEEYGEIYLGWDPEIRPDNAYKEEVDEGDEEDYSDDE